MSNRKKELSKCFPAHTNRSDCNLKEGDCVEVAVAHKFSIGDIIKIVGTVDTWMLLFERVSDGERKVEYLCYTKPLC